MLSRDIERRRTIVSVTTGSPSVIWVDQGVLDLSYPVPFQAVDWRLAFAPAHVTLGNFHCGEEDIAGRRARRDELAEQKEETAKGDALEEVDPRVEVDVAVGESDAKERQDRINGDQGTNLEDPVQQNAMSCAADLCQVVKTTYLLCSLGLLKCVAWRSMRMKMERLEKAAQLPEIAMLSLWNDQLPTTGFGASENSVSHGAERHFRGNIPATKCEGMLQVWLLLSSKMPILSVVPIGVTLDAFGVVIE